MKRGRFGQFLACTGYPECKTTRKFAAGTKTPKKPDVALDETCPQCGKAKLALEGRPLWRVHRVQQLSEM